MRRLASIALLATLAVSAASADVVPPRPTVRQGEWVLGRWRAGDYWFPGVARTVTPRNVTIDYDDGDQEVLPHHQVRRYDWAVGTRVQCNFQNAGTWYEGRITALENSTIEVLYDDGDRERTRTGRCRSR